MYMYILNKKPVGICVYVHLLVGKLMVGVEQIIAFQTFDWPTAANQFKTRQRPVDWPSAKLIDSKWRALLTRMIDNYWAQL